MEGLFLNCAMNSRGIQLSGGIGNEMAQLLGEQIRGENKNMKIQKKYKNTKYKKLKIKDTKAQKYSYQMALAPCMIFAVNGTTGLNMAGYDIKRFHSKLSTDNDWVIFLLFGHRHHNQHPIR